MVFQFFLSRYLTDFDKKNTVYCKSWLHNTVKFSNFLDQWLSVNCRSKFPVFCGIVVRNFHLNVNKTAADRAIEIGQKPKKGEKKMQFFGLCPSLISH
jgi:hypothetical protein